MAPSPAVLLGTPLSAGKPPLRHLRPRCDSLRSKLRLPAGHARRVIVAAAEARRGAVARPGGAAARVEPAVGAATHLVDRPVVVGPTLVLLLLPDGQGAGVLCDLLWGGAGAAPWTAVYPSMSGRGRTSTRFIGQLNSAAKSSRAQSSRDSQPRDAAAATSATRTGTLVGRHTFIRRPYQRSQVCPRLNARVFWRHPPKGATATEGPCAPKAEEGEGNEAPASPATSSSSRRTG